MVKRIIFDLDNTLIIWNDEWWSTVKETFDFYNIPYDSKILPYFKKASNNYLNSCTKMNKIKMSKYLSKELNIKLPDTFVETWTFFLGEATLEKNLKLVSFLERLNEKYSLTIATNWFYNQQIRKLERLGILHFFDEIVTADNFRRKPYPDMYNYLLHNYKLNEVIVVGDSYISDIKGALDLGIKTYFITEADLDKKSYTCTVISSIYDLEKYL